MPTARTARTPDRAPRPGPVGIRWPSDAYERVAKAADALDVTTPALVRLASETVAELVLSGARLPKPFERAIVEHLEAGR